MKPTAAILSPVSPQGIHWADHGGSHGRGHPSLSTFQGSTLRFRRGFTREEALGIQFVSYGTTP